MRLGGPLFEEGVPVYQLRFCDSAGSWIQAVKNAGYRAAYCPVNPGSEREKINEYAQAAKKADIIIAEVGAWSNPLSPDKAERDKAKTKCKQALLLADRIGANCCVNISGSRGQKWDGPDKQDLTEETFEMIIDVVREIIDEVQPTRTFYALETMPWMYPDSADSYLRLIKAVERRFFAVHFDPVNLINSPHRYFTNGVLIKEFVRKLGGYIRSCHAKDIILSNKLTVHLDEARPGTGGLDYRTFLQEVNRISDDIPLMLEHLPSEEEYRLATGYIRGIAKEERISL